MDLIKTELLSGEELLAGINEAVPAVPFQTRLLLLIDEGVGVVRNDMREATGGHLSHQELKELSRKRFIALAYNHWREADRYERESRKRKLE